MLLMPKDLNKNLWKVRLMPTVTHYYFTYPICSCNCELSRYERIPDNLQLHSCDYPYSAGANNQPCMRHFINEAFLLEHQANFHGVDILPLPPKNAMMSM